MFFILVAGGPCSGKTTVVNGLSRILIGMGYKVYVIRDWARDIIKREKVKGDKGILPWTNRYMFEYEVIRAHLNEYEALLKNDKNYDIVLEDGGGFAAKAYCIVDGVPIPPIYNELLKHAHIVDLVLLMDYPRKYFTDTERWEDKEYAMRIHEKIIEVHKEIFGDRVVLLSYCTRPEDKIRNALKEILLRIGGKR